MLPGYVTSIILHILVVVFHSREAWVFRAVFVLQTCGCIPLCSATALESESRVCSMRVREGRWEREREESRQIGLGTPNSTVDSSCEWHKFHT